MRFVTVVLAVVGFALLVTRPAAAGPTQAELETAALSLNEVAPHLAPRLVAGGQLNVTERQRGPLAAPVTNYRVTYQRGVFGALSSGAGAFRIFNEYLEILLVDATAGMPATELMAFDCRCQGTRTDQTPPAIGQNAAWYTMRTDEINYDVLTWQHGDILARLVAGTLINHPAAPPPIPAPELARQQQEKLAAAFALPSPTASPSPVATLAPSPMPVSTPPITMASPPAPAPTVLLRDLGALGIVLTDAQGLTLYTSDADPPDTSACLDVCTMTWPPLLLDAGGPTAPDGLTGVLTVTVRPDGRRQVTHGGKPLYRYTGDQQPGDALGDGIDGIWHVAVAAAPAPPSE